MSAFSVKWIYVLDQDYSFNLQPYLPKDFAAGCAFEDSRHHRWLEIHPNGMAIVKAHYAWDGCTPKFAIWDMVIGTPDGVPNTETQKPKAYYASLLHDVLYQFLDAGLPLKREDADQVFLDLLTRDRFGPRQVYYAAVRAFGGVSRWFTRWKRSYQGRQVPL